MNAEASDVILNIKIVNYFSADQFSQHSKLKYIITPGCGSRYNEVMHCSTAEVVADQDCLDGEHGVLPTPSRYLKLLQT